MNSKRSSVFQHFIKTTSFLIFLFSFVTAHTGEVHVVEINGAIGPATADHFVRSLEVAAEEGAMLVVMKLDTPGGLVESLRDMVKAILASPIPVACYVAPNGARAASAGTYLSYASHIAAMAPVTNIGSSTPVSIGGGGGIFPSPEDGDSPFENPLDEAEKEGEESEDDSSTPPPGAMEKKVLNDAVAYIRSLAELRGRNADWAEKTVIEAANLTASEALEINVIDYVASSLDDLLSQINGKTIAEVNGRDVTLDTTNATIVEVETDWRYDFLKTITNPNIAYLLLLIGINALIFEFYSPGLGAGGVVGVICLLLAAYALQMLPVNYVGLALIVVGIGLLVAETITPTYGVLGIGGVVALGAGSVLLFDTDLEAFKVSFGVVLAITVATAGIIIFVASKAFKQWRKGPVSGVDAVVGSEATVLEDFEGQGRVRAAGEIWAATSESPLSKNDVVVVTSMTGLTLVVEKVE